MADGDTITAALFNDEFNRLLTAFSYASSSTTGHQHDGTAGEGGNIPTIGDQDFLNKIAVDSTNNRWGFYVEVSSAAVEQIRIQDGAIVPVTDNDIDLGTSSLEFKDAYFDGTVTTDALVADTADINGGTVDGATIGANSATTIVGTTITANTAFVPDASDGAALGTSSLQFSDLYVADGAVVYFGDDQDVSLTHVADTGLLLSSTDQLQFGDSGTYIHQSADGVLDLVADTEIEINATTVDINGAVDISGNLEVGGNLTVTGTTTLNGGTLTLGDAATDNVVFGADVNSSIIPNTDSAYDLGSSSQEWRDLYIDGTAYLDAINFNGTAISASAAEINILDGVTASASELNIMDGVTATTGELNTLDGVTAVVGELNYLDLGSTAVGTAIASKAVVLDSNKDYTGIRNLTLSGDLTISGDDLTMGTNTSGHLLIADGTNFNPTAVGDLSEISTVANDDVLLAVDTSGGGLKKISRSTLVSGLAASGAISNVVEDTTPQLGGDLDVDGNALTSTSNGNIALSPNGSGVVRIDGNVDIQSGEIVLKNAGSVSNVKFYCESSNAHYTQLQSAAHSDYSGNVTLTLPASTDTLVGKATTDTLTNKTLTSPKINEDVAVTATATELNLIDGSTAGTVVASKAVVVDSNKDIASFRNVTLTGELDAATLDISGNADIDGTLETDALSLNGTAVTSTAAELNILDAVSRGSLIYGNSSGATALLTKGSASTVLTSDGTDIAWAAPAASGVTYVTKTANYTTQDLEGVLANTSGGAFTVTLPASPSAGAQVIVADSGDAFGTNNLTVARNGETIDGTAANLVLDITGVSVQFVYNGSTWRVYAQVGGKGGTAVNTTATQTLTNKTLTSAVLNTGVSGTAVLDEDNMASNSATKLATQQSIKAYVDSQVDSTEFVLEDDDGTEVTVSNAKEVKFIGSGITTNWTDTDNGTDGDPYDLTFTVDAAQTGITSLLATDIKIGEDDETKIDFETADEIHFYANNVEQVYLGDNIFGPQSDSDVDLGSSSVRWKDAYVDSITVTGEVDAASLDISGNVDVDGTLETDNLTIGGAQGSDGQVLTSTGSGVGWENAAAGGTSGMQVLSTVTASNSATVDLETTFDSTYDDYIIMISDYVPATDGTDLYMQYKIGGSYQSASSSYNTVYVYNYHSSSSISIENTGGTTSYIMVARSIGNAYNEVGQFKVTLSNVHDTGRATPAYCYGSCKNSSGESQGGFSHGIDASGGAVTGVRFKSSTGNITSGNFRLYGVAKS